MEIISKAINAMYGTNLGRDDVIDLGKKIIRTELTFNERAGITYDMNDFPSFFRDVPSDPLDLHVTFPKDVFKNFWKRLEE